MSIAVPSTQGDEQLDKADFEQRIEDVRIWFDSRFGGDTTIRGGGGFVMDGELIDEPVAIVESSMSKDTYMDKMKEFIDYVEEVQLNWEQNSILYQIDGKVFIYPKQDFIDNDLQIAREMVRVT